MPGSIIGGQKTKQKLIDKLGESEYSQRMATMGSKGGKVRTEKGFSKSGLASKAGKLGAGKKKIYIPESKGGVERLVKLRDEGKTWVELGVIFELNWWVVRARYLEYAQGVYKGV